MRLFIMTLIAVICAGSAFAQPVWGPFTIVESEAGITNPQIVMRSADTADVFYQIDNEVFHVTVDLTSGFFPAEPSAFVMDDESWTRRLYDVVWTGTGWAALAYNTTILYNFTWVVQGTDSIESYSLIDQGNFGDGTWTSSSSWNAVFQLHPRGFGGFCASWINVWTYYNGQWGEGGGGPVLHDFLPDGRARITAEYFSGPWPDDRQSIIVFSTSAETEMLLLCEPSLRSYRLTWDTYDGLLQIGYISCAAKNTCSLICRDSTVFVVSATINSTLPRILRIEDFHWCSELRTLPDEPIAGASDPDYGLAWLASHQSAILLYRADTTGAEHLPAGTMHWPDAGQRIFESNIAMSGTGNIAAAWTEGAESAGGASVLKIKTVGWNTPLKANDRNLISQPSSFSLSAFPNPFNSEVRFEYELPRSQKIEINVLNLLGQQVALIESGLRDAGRHSALWTPQTGSGIYYARLQSESQIQTIKIAYVR